MKKVNAVAVVGPTATGKSALAIALAEAFDGEVFRATRMSLDPLAGSYNGGRWMRRDAAAIRRDARVAPDRPRLGGERTSCVYDRRRSQVTWS